MLEETIHTRTFQVTVSFTDEQRDKFLEEVLLNAHNLPPNAPPISEIIRSEIINNLQDVGLDASVTIVERMKVG